MSCLWARDECAALYANPQPQRRFQSVGASAGWGAGAAVETKARPALRQRCSSGVFHSRWCQDGSEGRESGTRGGYHGNQQCGNAPSRACLGLKKKEANDIFLNSISFGEWLRTNPLWNSDEFLAYLLVSSSLSHNYPEDV